MRTPSLIPEAEDLPGEPLVLTGVHLYKVDVVSLNADWYEEVLRTTRILPVRDMMHA